VRRSKDNGKTWGVPSRTVATAPRGPIPLKDGRLIYVGTGDGIAVEDIYYQKDRPDEKPCLMDTYWRLPK